MAEPDFKLLTIDERSFPVGVTYYARSKLGRSMQTKLLPAIPAQLTPCIQEGFLTLHKMGAGACIALTSFGQWGLGVIEQSYHERLQLLLQQMMDEKQVLVHQLARCKGRVLILVPVKDGSEVGAHLVGFQVAEGLLAFHERLLERRALSLVFDLDNTLLAASTAEQLRSNVHAMQGKIHSYLRRNFPKGWKDADAARKEGLVLRGTPEEQQRLKDELARMEHVLAAYEKDLKAIQRRASSGATSYGPFLSMAGLQLDGGGQYMPEPTYTILDGEPVILDMYVAGQTESTFIMRKRDGIDHLLDLLQTTCDLPPDSVEHHPDHYEVSVCTTGQPAYAERVWGHLDPLHRVIPKQSLSSRFLVIDRSAQQDPRARDVKQVDMVAGVGTQAEGRTPVDPAQPGSLVPMMFIVDDRKEVWGEPERDQIYQVEPYVPNNRLYTGTGSLPQWEEERTKAMTDLSAQLLRNLINWGPKAAAAEKSVHDLLERIRGRPLDLATEEDEFARLVPSPQPATLWEMKEAKDVEPAQPQPQASPDTSASTGTAAGASQS